jgi:hypothetical protein
VTAIEVVIEHEMEVGASPATGDAEVEAFGAWQAKQRAAYDAEQEAEAATVHTRALLSAARAAGRAA